MIGVVWGSAIAPSQALAQSPVGSAHGRTTAGSVVTLRDTDTGVTTRQTADAKGDFVFSALPPGQYRVSDASGLTADIDVSAGTGTAVTFDAVQTVIVQGRRAINPIDVKSVESTSVFTATKLDTLPVAREVSSVGLLAPGTVKNSHPNFEDAISIGGSSPAENGYYINGFDVTNIRNFTTYADLPFDAVAQVQVKTGGYGAEYGRSLGGVLSQVTKRGTNRWKFGGSVTTAPSALSGKGRDALSRNPDHVGTDQAYQVFTSANREDLTQYSLYAAGPLIKDKLFVYALYEGRDEQRDFYESFSSISLKNTSPQYLLKLDYYLTPDHHFEYTGIHNKSVTTFSTYSNLRTDSEGYPVFDDFGWPVFDYFSTRRGASDGGYDLVHGGRVNILNYNGRLSDNLTVSVMYGHLESFFYAQDPAVAYPEAALCVAADDSRSNIDAMIPVGCWNEQQFVISDIFADPNKDTREALRLDAEWTLGDHRVRLGYDKESFASSKRGEIYSGGAYYRYFNVDEGEGRDVNGEWLPTGTTYARLRVYNAASAVYKVENTAFYIEDHWQVTPSLRLYAGLRNETFTNRNAAGDVFAEAHDLWAPRLGFSWDVTGDSALKVFGTFGRYYIPVSTSTNIRMAGVEYRTEEFFVVDGLDPATGLPVGAGAQIGDKSLFGSLEPYPAQSLVTKNLRPMYQDELILGVQKRFSQDLTLGGRSVYRKVGAGMDDVCARQPFVDWAEDNGIGDFDPFAVPTCYLVNPGKDVALEFDYNGDGTLDRVDVEARYFGLPEYKREYLSLELFGNLSGARWSLDGSYTLSFSKGNTEGYVNSSLGNVSPGLTEDWDNFMLMRGSGGYLPNDRRHSFKLFGTFAVSNEFLVGGNLIVQSGLPLNCFGFADLSDPRIGLDSLAFTGPTSFYCAGSDGNQSLGQRGQEGRGDWLYNLDASLTYTPGWGRGHISFQAVVYNLLDLRAITRHNQASQTGSAADPAYNQNFLGPLQYQRPRSGQLTVRYNF